MKSQGEESLFDKSIRSLVQHKGRTLLSKSENLEEDQEDPCQSAQFLTLEMKFEIKEVG